MYVLNQIKGLKRFIKNIGNLIMQGHKSLACYTCETEFYNACVHRRAVAREVRS